MNIKIPTLLVGLATLPFANVSHAAVFAAEVIDYQPGTGATLTDPSSALGLPYHTVGEGTGFDGALTPFNPHYESDQIVQVGEGGQLVLRLSHYATAGGRIGIFANVGLIDTDFPNGVAGDPVGTFGVDPVTVDFSLDGNSWFGSLTVSLDQPSAYFTDAAGTSPADFGQDHNNTLADYAGKNLSGILAQLSGSAGGNWLDIATGSAPEIAYVRIAVEDDNDPNTTITAEIDAVSIENNSVGAAIPEPSSFALALTALALGIRRRR